VGLLQEDLHLALASRRLHCHMSAPVVLLGAVAAALAALGWAPLGPHYVIDGSLGLALPTFVAEPIWGKYRSH